MLCLFVRNKSIFCNKVLVHIEGLGVEVLLSVGSGIPLPRGHQYDTSRISAGIFVLVDAKSCLHVANRSLQSWTITGTNTPVSHSL